MKQERLCKHCGAVLTKPSQKVYCCSACAIADHAEQRWEKIEELGEIRASGRFNETDRREARSYLEHKYGHRCMSCGLETWVDKPIPLVVDHIDGNTSNHKLENLRLICPNCDALSSTYKSRNLDNDKHVITGRSDRRREEYDSKLKSNGFERVIRTREHGICLECGKDFVKRRHSQKYCSRVCADKHR